MRVDKLNDEKFWEAYKFFEDFIGEEASREYIKNGTMMEEMKRFECTVYEDGTIGPADDVNTLGGLQIYEYADEGAFEKALSYATDMAKEYNWSYKSFEDLCRVLDEKGVVFDDYGNPGWVDVDDGNNSSPMLDKVIDGLRKSVEDFADAVNSKGIKSVEVETGFNPSFDRTEIYVWVYFTDGSLATIPVGWYQGEPNSESTEEYKFGKIYGYCEA